MGLSCCHSQTLQGPIGCQYKWIFSLQDPRAGVRGLRAACAIYVFASFDHGSHLYITTRVGFTRQEATKTQDARSRLAGWVNVSRNKPKSRHLVFCLAVAQGMTQGLAMNVEIPKKETPRDCYMGLSISHCLWTSEFFPLVSPGLWSHPNPLK